MHVGPTVPSLFVLLYITVFSDKSIYLYIHGYYCTPVGPTAPQSLLFGLTSRPRALRYLKVSGGGGGFYLWETFVRLPATFAPASEA